ncbi:MAG: hypothetical protein GF315_11900 [candidate division Zixibacteria bacterium]|nr:hypothetical protein [candidate division Zixibacteria bacterium]
MHYRLRRIGVWSAVKISFLINGLLGVCVGFVAGLFMFLFSALMSRLTYLPSDVYGDMAFSSPMIGGVAALVLLPLFYGFLLAVVNGIILTAIAVWLYNLFARALGGVELEFEEGRVPVVYKKTTPKPAVPQAPPPQQPESPPESPPPPPEPEESDETEKKKDDDDKYKPPPTSEGGVDV